MSEKIWVDHEELANENQERLKRIASTQINGHHINLEPILFTGNRLEHLIESVHGPMVEGNDARIRFEFTWQQVVAQICEQAEGEIRALRLRAQGARGKSKLIVPGQ